MPPPLCNRAVPLSYEGRWDSVRLFLLGLLAVLRVVLLVPLPRRCPGWRVPVAPSFPAPPRAQGDGTNFGLSVCEETAPHFAGFPAAPLASLFLFLEFGQKEGYKGFIFSFRNPPHSYFPFLCLHDFPPCPFPPFFSLSHFSLLANG